MPTSQNTSTLSVLSSTPAKSSILKDNSQKIENTMSDPYIPPPDSSKMVWPIPVEIRLMIYSLVVINRDCPILIDSPKRTTPHKKEIYSRNLANLLGINKQINEEVTSVFYSKNIWVVGNGIWGSKTMTNEQALRAFISRVPRHNLAQIKNIVCSRPLWHSMMTNFTRYFKFTLGWVMLDMCLGQRATPKYCRQWVGH